MHAEVPPVAERGGRPAEPPESVFTARRNGAALELRELWRYRELLLTLAWRDVKVRYKQTVLGAAWAVLQPALTMVVFTLVMGRLAGETDGDVPYPLFAYAGLLPWTFFASTVVSAGNSVVDSERLVSKVYFPRLAIPFATAGHGLVDLAVASGLLFILMAAYGARPGWGLLAVPALVLLIALAALGVGSLLAALNVTYRDFRYVMPFLVQLWLFATPSVYLPAAADTVPAAGGLGLLLRLNPLVGLVAAFRAAVLDRPIPWADLCYGSAGAAVLFTLGCAYFRRAEDTFADII